MSDIMGSLEDAVCYRAADRVMSILFDYCNPREGALCNKASIVGEKVKKIEKDYGYPVLLV